MDTDRFKRILEEELGILPEEIDFIISETSYPCSEKEDVCDIIDIANEEMKKIDSTQIDSEFKKTFTMESTENLFYLINSGEWTEEDLKTYVDMLDSDGVLELRVSDGSLFAKTVISKKELSEVMEIDEGLIKNVPVNGKYNFYIINTTPKCCGIKKSIEREYDPTELIEELKKIGEKDYNIAESIDSLQQMIFNACFKDKYLNKINFMVDIEDEVVAISVNAYIPYFSKVLGLVLGVNPSLFIEVNTPIGTALLIDTRRWVLEPNFGDEKWLH